ncbi:MAG: YbjN domain-containing protein [Candidatus Dormibacteraeota bacterium]|nr:YbjN domain-containing protein [Candidatus Dormibacteraeota bacterium]MBV9526161.1 YbjN domain-containing protein [Candidatus Dormibacteraeota bacterium]
MSSVLAVLCEIEREGAYVIFENADRPDEYVQVSHRGADGLLAEVGSREWAEPTHPLSDVARSALEVLRFTGGGPERNYVNQALPTEPGGAARTLAGALDAAYSRRGPDLVVKTNAAEVESWLREQGLWIQQPTALPVAEPLQQNMIRAALRAHGWRIFHDESGEGFMTWWGWDTSLGMGLHMHVDVCGNAPWRVLAIVGIGDRPIPEAERPRMLELINTWHEDRRWPCVSLARQEGEDSSWLHFGWSLPAGAGVTQGLVNDTIGAVADSALDFLRWLNPQRRTSDAPQMAG